MSAAVTDREAALDSLADALCRMLARRWQALEAERAEHEDAAREQAGGEGSDDHVPCHQLQARS